MMPSGTGSSGMDPAESRARREHPENCFEERLWKIVLFAENKSPL